MSDEQKANIRKKLPKWLKAEPGFQFQDSEGDPVIVIGWGGWRDSEALGSLSLVPRTSTAEGSGLDERANYALFNIVFKPATLVGAYSYKGEWHLCSIPDLEDLENCSPL